MIPRPTTDTAPDEATRSVLAWWDVLKARRTYHGKIPEFVAKWERKGDLKDLNERQGAQMHFLDLCDMLDVPSPNDSDDYVFEKSTLMLGGKRGYADVFKRGYFAWEYKAPGGNLDAALRQLLMYALALDNPPLLVVSDRFTIEIHTHFNGTPSTKTVVDVSRLEEPAQLDILRRLFADPESFRPKQTVQALTEEAADAFATLAEAMRSRVVADPQDAQPTAVHAQKVAHFLTQCVFCLFAEDAKILESDSFSRILGLKAPPVLIQRQFTQLFTAMKSGDLFGADFIPWFNGGLFETVDVPELQAMDITVLKNARAKDWSQIDVSIFGTLFERGLNPAKRSQLGAHYTDTATIARLIEPVVARPLLLEWERTRLAMADLLAVQGKAKEEERNRQIATERMVQFLEKLKNYRILDPACGSGNFLYLALKTLKDIEHKVNTEAQLLGLHRQVDSYTSPANVLGIELDSYAAELARVSVWIGELQWRNHHGYGFPSDPILQTLDHIECRDAILTADGKEADWPVASVVIGNPPFLGGKKFVSELGEGYTAQLHAAFKGRVPGLADLVTYWFERARSQMMQGKLSAAGLVSTNSIRNGFSREVLERVAADTPIFAAWSDEPWVNEGAAVRVSLVAFSRFVYDRTLNGALVEKITADLSIATHDNTLDLTTAKPLEANQGVAFQGTTRSGPFDITGELARHWLSLPNPHGKPNSDVVRPWSNGLDVTRRASDTWIIDFGIGMSFDEAALYEAPFAHCLQHVKPTRVGNRNPRLVEQWWHYDGVRVKLREATKNLKRYIATTITAKHRLFVWKDISTLPDATLVAIASDSDAVFGVLHSRIHEVWSLRMCSWMGKGNDPRYVLEPCFETFPFPFKIKSEDGLEANLDKAFSAIAAASQSLCALRDRWLNPPEYTRRLPEVLAGYPERILPRDDLTEAQLAELKKRTLTNLYNLRPSWLKSAHEALDAAVAVAYGWTDYSAAMTDEVILGRLLGLNAAASAS